MKSTKKSRWLPGPGTLVAAAFIGPGTVTMCTLAGVKSGYSLLWALTFSTLTTIVIQEMAARLGVVSRMGLAQAMRKKLTQPVIRIIAIFLVLSAIFIGNSAYEAGNIAGALLGLEHFTTNGRTFFPLIFGVIAGVFLWKGNSELLQRFLVGLVLLMSLCFIITAALTFPNMGDVIKGLLVPSFKPDEILLVTGLVGTTVVPYNLFLHASIARDKWQVEDLSAVKMDTIISILLGGIVSMCILIAAASIQGTEVTNAAGLAKSVEPIFGKGAGYLIALGLAAAGITSAITAPFAAAIATKGILGWEISDQHWKYRMVWGIVLIIGVIFASFNIRPIQIIQFAQVTNGILLPLIAGYLLYMVNQSDIMHGHKNNLRQNIAGFIIVLICFGLSISTIYKLFF